MLTRILAVQERVEKLVGRVGVAETCQALDDGAGGKAAGGIRTRQDAEAMFQAGATRLGCSASLAIVGEM